MSLGKKWLGIMIRLENIMLIKPPIMLCFYAQTLWYLCCCSNQLCLIFTPKCFSDLPKDLYCWSQDMNNQILVCSILISAGVGALSSIFKVLAEFLQTQCWACSQLISVLSGPSDDIIQVDELDANCIHMVLELCLRDMQIHHTLFLGYILC